MIEGSTAVSQARGQCELIAIHRSYDSHRVIVYLIFDQYNEALQTNRG